ncbi:amidohydrolase family protein [Streptosporangium sp. NPDC004631]
MSTLAIRNVTLLDGTGGTARAASSVHVTDGRIGWVGDASAEPQDVTVSQVIDGTGRTLLPGFIDSHVHLCADPERPGRYDPLQVSTERLAMEVLSHAQDALRAGVTTLADCGGRDYVTLDVRDAILAGSVLGPRIMTTGLGISITGGHFHWYSIEADDVAELRKATRTLVKRGVDFIKLFGTGGGSTMGSNPALAQYTVEEFRTVIEEAERGGIRVTTHVHGTPGIRNAVEAGIHRLEHVQFFDAEGDIRFDAELAGQILDAGIPISLGMAKRWRTEQAIDGFLTPRQLQQRDLRDKRIQVLRNFREAGVKLVASTDAGMTMTPFDDLPHLMSFLTSQISMTIPEVIHSVTGRAATALGIDADHGTIEVGRLADLVLADGDVSVGLEPLFGELDVFRAGRRLVHRGRLTGPATRHAMDTADQEAP